MGTNLTFSNASTALFERLESDANHCSVALINLFLFYFTLLYLIIFQKKKKKNLKITGFLVLQS